MAVLEESLAATRLHLTHEATHIHALSRQALERCIRTLEQVLHGSVSRSTKARAEYCQIVAEGMSKKLQVQRAQLLSQTKSPEWEAALHTHAAHVDREHMACKRRIREVEEQLEAYYQQTTSATTTTGTGMSSRGVSAAEYQQYSEIIREVSKMRADIAKVENR